MQLSPTKMLELQEEVARAIADADDFDYRKSFPMSQQAEYEEQKKQMDGYMVKAKAAIAAMKTFRVY